MRFDLLTISCALAFSSMACVAVTQPAGDPQGRSRIHGRRQKGDKAEDASVAAWADKQQEFDAKFADEIAAFHTLEPKLKAGDGGADLVAQADDLREKFLKRCVAESGWSTVACRSGTFARDIAELLAPIRLKLGDKVGSYMDSQELLDFDDMRSPEAKAKAVEHRVEPAPLVRGTPPELKPLQDELEFTAEEVQSIAKNKDTATIHFKTRVSGSSSTSCQSGHLIVDSAGNVGVSNPCVTDTRTDVQKFAPVTVPLAEVDGITPGQRAFVLSPKKGKRAGHVVDLWPDLQTKKYLRYRNTPMERSKPGYP